MASARRLLSYAGSPLPYIPPDFAARIAAHAPSHRLSLALTPTPIHPWSLPGLPAGVRVSVKRDDMTGSTAGGNKVRKLEFLLADALLSGASAVITCGGLQSNHARATSVLCRELGLACHVLLRSRDASPSAAGSAGNVLLHRLVGARVHLIRPGPYATTMRPRMETLARRLAADGVSARCVCVGGSDATGLWGYIDAFRELLAQGADDFSHLVVAVGSGGTASGLAIANHLAGGRMQVHAVAVCDTPAYFYAHVDEMLAAVGLAGETCARDIIRIHQGKGRGYAVSTQEEMRFCVEVARATGVVLDRTYTGKAARGMMGEIAKGAQGAFGEEANVLFVHTGGLLSVFDGEIEGEVADASVETWVD